MGAPYIQFGSGLLWLQPNAGNLTVNPTPVRPFTLQDVKIGQKGKIEMLRGQYQYPDDTAKGDVDGTFEFSMGRRDFFFLNQIFDADVVAAGGTSVITDVVAIGSSITPTPPASGTFASDLGVVLTSNNKEFTLSLTSGPAAGSYYQTGGVYTFNATDVSTGGNVSIAYSYTQSTVGASYQVNQQVQGYGPQFAAYIADTYQPVTSSGTVYSLIYLHAAKISDVEFDNKRSGYGMVSLKGAYFAAPTGRVIDFFSNVG